MATETIPADTEAKPASTSIPAQGSVLPRLARTAFWVLALSLIGLNGWLAWDQRPLPELSTVEDWIRHDDFRRAKGALDARLQRSPHDGEARIMLARALAGQNDYAGAARQLHEVPFWWPKKAEAVFQEGRFAMAAGRAKQAEAAWKICVANDPLHPTPPRFFTESVQELVQLYNLEERKSEARELLWWAYQQTEPSHHGTILIMSLWVDMYKNDPPQAVSRLRRFVAAAPDDWEAQRALAHNLVSLNQFDEAERVIQACLQALPDDARIWAEWLILLNRRGDRGGLARALAQLPPQADRNPEIWKMRGLYRERTGDPAGAAAAYRQAVELEPTDEDAFYRLAILEPRLGQREQAAAHLARYKQLHEARAHLRESYDAYLDESKQPQVGAGSLGRITSRLAELCDAIGWTREAGAWRGLLARK